MNIANRDVTLSVVFRLDDSDDWHEWSTGHRTASEAVVSAEALVKFPPVPEIRFERVTRTRERLSLHDLAAEDAAASAVVAPPTDRADLRDRIAAAIWERQNPGRRWADCEHRWRADAKADADAVLAVLPAVADRAAVLRGAIARVRRIPVQCTGLTGPVWFGQGWQDAIREFEEIAERLADEDQRHMAVEAHGTGTQQPEVRQRETVEYFLQCQQDDGTWEDASSFMDDLDWAQKRLAGKRAKYPEFTWRMAQRTTRVVVQPLTDEPAPVAQQPAAEVCRPVEVDGETVLVRGASEMTEQERGYFAEIVRAAKRKYAAEHGAEQQAAAADGEETPA